MTSETKPSTSGYAMNLVVGVTLGLAAFALLGPGVWGVFSLLVIPWLGPALWLYLRRRREKARAAS